MSGFVFRRRVKLDDHTTANVSKGGASISHRRGRVTVNSRRGVSVRIFKGLSWRSKWVTLAEFLDARISDDLRRDQERLITSLMDTGATATQIEEKARSTMAWAMIGMHHAMRQVGMSAMAAFPKLNDSWLRRQAAVYSTHPDYRAEWTP